MKKRIAKVRTAVIPVAGRGTRFQPITKAVPKELLPLVDTPILHQIILEAARSGIENIVLITSRGKYAIEDYFDSDFIEPELQNIKITSVRQKTPMGLGHAILCAKHAVNNEPFAVLLGDDLIDADDTDTNTPGVPCTRQLVDLHLEKNGAPIVGVMEVPKDETSKYGIVAGEKIAPGLIKVNGLVEKPAPAKAPSRFAIPGRYILTPEIFEILENTKPSVGNEIQLTDALQVLAKKQDMYALKFKGRRFDAGNRFGYMEACLHYAMKRSDVREPLIELIHQLSDKYRK